MKQLTILFLIALLSSSCAAFKTPNFGSVSIGMSKEEVIKRLGNKYTIISAKKYDDGVLEILQYQRFATVSTTGNDNDYNWLFFFNNQLDEWGPKTNYAPFNEYNYYRKHRNRQ